MATQTISSTSANDVYSNTITRSSDTVMFAYVITWNANETGECWVETYAHDNARWAVIAGPVSMETGGSVAFNVGPVPHIRIGTRLDVGGPEDTIVDHVEVSIS